MGQGHWGAAMGPEKPDSVRAGGQAGRQGLPGAGGFLEQKGHGTMHGAGTAWRRVGWGGFMIGVSEHSLLLVPVKHVVIAPWKCLCLPQPWGAVS